MYFTKRDVCLRYLVRHWLVITIVLFLGLVSTATPPAWAAPVLGPMQQTVPRVDFHLNLPQIMHVQTPVDIIFADDFEAGNFSSWSASKTGKDALRVSPTAALVGTQGLQVVISGTTAIYLTDDQPAAEQHYRARFYFDPNSIVMASDDNHIIFYGYNGTPEQVLRVQFRFFNGAYQLRAALREDSATWQNSSWSTISDAAHLLEIDWQAATTVAANDGSLTVWIDDVPTDDLTGYDNDTQRIDSVRLGAVSGIDTGTQGTYYFDAFESHR